MSNVDHDLETLIVRHLDSELSEEEELELNRELIRNPDARQLLDDYKRADELAVAALNRAIPDEGTLKPTALTTAPIRPRRAGYYRAWWVIPGAIAAAILALVIPHPSVDPDSKGPITITERLQSPPEEITGSRPNSAQEIMRDVSTSPFGQRIKRDTGREVFGVVGDDGNVYWIQVDRIRTMKRPRLPAPSWRPDEAM